MRLPDDQVRRMLEQTLIPPTNVVELDPDTFEAATIRLQSVEGNLAEQYQVNSCLSRTRFNRLASRAEVDLITDFYVTTAADGYDELVKAGSRWVLPMDAAPGWVQRLVGPLSTHPAVTASLYNCDLLVGVDHNLWRLIPNRSGFMYEGTWSPELAGEVAAAVPTIQDRETPPGGVLMLVGHIARASYLSGDRAFRATAIGCGSVLGMLWAVLGTQTPFVRVTVTHQFLDAPVNAAARCDGVERGVQVLCLVDPVPAQPRKESERD